MKAESPHLTAQLVLRVPPPLRDRLKSAAEAEGRSLTNLTRRILERWASEQPSEAVRHA
jgi:predicted HicB family RNase H-like nuclease